MPGHIPARPLSYALALALLPLVGCASRPRAHDAPRAASSPPRATPHAPRARAALPSCEIAERSAHAPVARRPAGDPGAREAAQRGLTFVSREAVHWQQQHNCYGCHVQAVTFEALTVGRENRYDISDPEFREVMRGLLDINGGHRHAGGLSVGGHGMPTTSRTFGGAAFARYDATVATDLSDDLLAVAGQLREVQREDGSLANDDTRFPVVEGPTQATTQALQTWRQAYARSADERWLGPIRSAERWLQERGRALSDDPQASTVQLNYAVMGLLAAGATPSEQSLEALGARLRQRQRDDGGWGYREGEDSNAFATGQTLHALRSLGASDDDPRVARGTRWLVEHQQQDGGWSSGGAGKAEAMWAVFGLVSIDVMSLSMEGARDGQHVEGALALRGHAVDNGTAPVRQVDVLVDDVPVARGCGAAVEHRLDTAGLDPGLHTIDVVATNARGQSSRRRVEVYTGDHFLVRAAARWREGNTELSLRNVAPASVGGSVTVRVRPAPEGQAPGAPVWTRTVAAAQGPMQLAWDGHGTDGAARDPGRYVAELTLTDARGRARQTVEVPFVHDDPQRAAQRYGEVAGQLALDGAGGAAANAANAEVQLVDERGNVVQRTATTESGNYRFRNVSGGRYRVRV